MPRYLLVESKSPADGGDYAFELAKQLRDLQHNVTIYLIQDAVFATRKSFPAGKKLVDEAKGRQVTLLADEVSLRQRGITSERRNDAVRVGNMEEFTDLLMENSDKAIWH